MYTLLFGMGNVSIGLVQRVSLNGRKLVGSIYFCEYTQTTLNNQEVECLYIRKGCPFHTLPLECFEHLI